MTRCELTMHDHGPPGYPGFQLSVTFDYDAEAVEQLKDLVPKDQRTYDEATKTWWMAPVVRAEVIAWARKQFPHAELAEGETVTGLHTGVQLKRMPQLGLFEEESGEISGY